MDVENQELFSVYDQQDRIFLGNEYPSSHSAYSAQEDHSTSSEKLLEEWSVPGACTLNESEPEDMIQTMINPNEVYSSIRGAVESVSETDSGISDDQRPDSPEHSETGADPEPAHSYQAGADPEPAHSNLYQVVYGVSVMDGPKTQGAVSKTNLRSIELGSLNRSMLMPEACVVDTALTHPVCVRSPHSVTDTHTDITYSLMHFPDLTLTEEETRLLNQEGIVLPRDLPLTKAEERILKKVRRKIRNKQSAQESRRRKKEYIDGLENRVAACTAQNHQLQKQVLQLEHHNVSLISQLRRLQSLIKETSNKAAQTGTCIMIMAFSLMLLIFPSYNLIRLETPVNQQGYKPTGVISRTILTDPEWTQRWELAENADAMGSVELQEEAVPLAEDPAANPQHQPMAEGNRPDPGAEDQVPGDRRRRRGEEDSQLLITAKNSSSSSGPQGGWSQPANPTPRRDLPPGEPPTGPSSPGDTESLAKPGHADEM